MSLGASFGVAVVVEDGKEVEENVEDVAVDCDLSCDIDEYRVDEEIIVDEIGVIKRKRREWM
jgi:hypothetical protein